MAADNAIFESSFPWVFRIWGLNFLKSVFKVKKSFARRDFLNVTAWVTKPFSRALLYNGVFRGAAMIISWPLFAIQQDSLNILFSSPPNSVWHVV